MGNKEKILEYRQRLDKTLASHDLSNEEAIKCRLKNELLHSSPSENQDYVEHIVDKSGKQVLNSLDMLRSVEDGDWKMKQDTDEYRVMYREGPQGTPLHSLLVEGFVDGPMDVCVCLGWEVGLFHKWWPQFNFPTFKIIESKCVQKVRIGEQIDLVRMKCAWPLSAREVVVHCFEVEFLEDDLLIFVLNSVTDTESVDRSTHGFTNDGIPKAKDVVRAELVGGFALQKVTSNRSYFRIIVTMDMKLDFVPPSLINFLSRQIIGSGFELYKKAVASVAKGDEDFGKALKDTLYVRIREGLNQEKGLKINSEPKVLVVEKSADKCDGKSETESLPADATVTAKSSLGDNLVIRCKQEATSVSGERISKEKKVFISPEVEHALGILDNVISMVRGSGIINQTWSGLGSSNQKLVNSRTTPQDHSGGVICVKALNTDKRDANLSKDYCEVAIEVDGSNINGGEKSRQRKHRLCCFRSATDH
ncbi:uncharacterized protein LOC113300386 isoform X2 [Papaver somniferum]|uniref:uncharacterized protein LOC113300386 isoform X2 n=1 Tax=Papaver somniferum TaxID=3469 RepID=UPI000E705432|nr:uncharacterized protein LOC113300386 isoform X2 [Papaver somniferum]